MVRNTLSLLDNFNQLTPYAVGFDRMFDNLNTYVANNTQSTGFPPYNIRKEGDYNYVIEMALAGFGKKDIEVEVADATLTIKSLKDNSSSLLDIDGIFVAIGHKPNTDLFINKLYISRYVLLIFKNYRYFI